MDEPTDEQVAAFKRAWHRADIEGRAGERVRDGLRAAALPVPEPDHSMCARGVTDGKTVRFVAPDGVHTLHCVLTVDEARRFGYAIPEPEPTVVERAAAEIQRADERGDDSYKALARALADAGLLVRDGEQA